MEKKIVETTHTIQTVVYVANDGTEFEKEDFCKQYEQSAAAVLLTKLNDFTMVREIDTDVLNDSSDENIYRSVIPKTDKDIDTLNQLYYMFGGKYIDIPKFTAEDLGKPILVGYRFYNTKIDWCWFYKVTEFLKDITEDRFKLIDTKE